MPSWCVQELHIHMFLLANNEVYEFDSWTSPLWRRACFIVIGIVLQSASFLLSSKNQLFFPLPLATRFQFEWKTMPRVLHRKANYSPVVSGQLSYFFYAKIAVCWRRKRWSSVRLYSEVSFQNEEGTSCRKIGSPLRHIKNSLSCKCCCPYWHRPIRFIETHVL